MSDHLAPCLAHNAQCAEGVQTMLLTFLPSAPPSTLHPYLLAGEMLAQGAAGQGVGPASRKMCTSYARGFAACSLLGGSLTSAESPGLQESSLTRGQDPGFKSQSCQ